jgi:hypothetical protein
MVLVLLDQIVLTRKNQSHSRIHRISDIDERYPRSIHSIYADLTSNGRYLQPYPDIPSRTGGTVTASMSMPLTLGRRSFSRAMSTIRPRTGASSRKSSSSSTEIGPVYFQPSARGHTTHNMTRSEKGVDRYQLNTNDRDAANENFGRDVPMVLAEMYATTRSRWVHTSHKPLISSSDIGGAGLLNVNGRGNVCTPPRMTHTISAITSHSFKDDRRSTQHGCLLAHADNLTHATAMRVRDTTEDDSAEGELPLMLQAKSSFGTSYTSSFGVRPLRIKKTAKSKVRSRTRLYERSVNVQGTDSGRLACPQGCYDETQEEIDIEQLQKFMSDIDQSLTWEYVGNQPETSLPLPPSKPTTRSASTWGGTRSSPFIVGSTISRGNAKGTQSMHRPPLPFP